MAIGEGKYLEMIQVVMKIGRIQFIEQNFA